MTTEASLAAMDEAMAPDQRRMIPYDYAFRFQLTGQPGKVLNKTVNVSVEAPFVASSIGYGVIPEITPIPFGINVPGTGLTVRRRNFANISFARLLTPLRAKLAGVNVLGGEGWESVLRNGLKLNPVFADVVLRAINAGQPLPTGMMDKIFQAVGAPPEQIQFLYALFDEGSGRSFQSDPILNTAGLGTSDGERPFRHFARPITFAPRSTIRLEITEQSAFTGELHVSLHGYKILGGAGTPTDIRRGIPRSRRR